MVEVVYSFTFAASDPEYVTVIHAVAESPGGSPGPFRGTSVGGAGDSALASGPHEPEGEPAVELGLEGERVVRHALVHVEPDLGAPPQPGDPRVRDHRDADHLTDPFGI